MANEAQREGGEVSALPLDGSIGERASADPPGQPEGGKRRYSPPRLRSLGKVAELTFGGAGSVKDAGVRPSKKG
jgi:hypothetical protein